MIGCQSASGIWFLIAYQTYFLLQGGVTKAFEYTIMTSCIGFIGVNVGMFSMRHLFGRRNVLMIGAMGCCLCQLAPAIAASTSDDLTFRANIRCGSGFLCSGHGSCEHEVKSLDGR